MTTAADFYDMYGDREFLRPSLANCVSELIHRTYLTHIAGRVLEVGAGVGRFTVTLARKCSSIVVMDVSSQQLARNRSFLAERGILSKVECHIQGDVRDLPKLVDGTFDVVVCFRGPLNYCVESFDDAMGQMFGVLRPGGQLLFSVRTVFSGIRPYIDSAFRMTDLDAMHSAAAVIGSLKLQYPSSPTMRLFTTNEVMNLVRRHGGQVERASGDGALAPWLNAASRRELWFALLRIERRLADDPFGIANANHMIVAARKS